jgi:hypothetical protein
MWTTSEDVTRFQRLDEALHDVLARAASTRSEQQVATEDLALYLEWMELAREASTKVTPFADKSSPFALRSLSYGQMARDFEWLRRTVADEVSSARMMI